MAKRRQTKKNTGRSKRRRVRFRRTSKTGRTIGKSGGSLLNSKWGGLPQVLKFKFNYQDTYNHTGAVASYSRTSRRWNMNSIYDPDESGSGSQPALRDDLAALYKSYRVMGCAYRCRVVFNHLTDATQSPVCIRFHFGAEGEGYTSINAPDDRAMMPNTYEYVLSPNRTSPFVFKKYVRILDFYKGYRDASWMENLGAVMGADPAAKMQMVVDTERESYRAAGTTGAAADYNVTVQHKFMYYTQVFGFTKTAHVRD